MVGDDVDVAHLAAGSHGLAVEVDLGLRVGGEGVGEAGVQVLAGAAEQVLHDDAGPARGGVPERQIQDGAHVLLELSGDGPVHGPVPGVVRAHGQLVDLEAGAHAGGLEELDGEHAGDVQLLGQPHGGGGGGLGDGRVQVPGGGDHEVAHAGHLHGVHHGVGRDPPGGGAGHLGGELAGERHEGLGEQRGDAGAQPRAQGAVRGGGTGVVGVVELQDALAVVAAARGLQDHGPAVLVAEREDLVEVPHRGPGRVRQAEALDGGAHHQLVLGVLQGLGAGAHGDADLLQHAQVLGGHVLVVEGHHVHRGGEGAQVRQVRVVADHMRGHLGRGRVRGLREHAEGHAELRGGARHHAGQLPAADHTESRGSHRSRLVASSENSVTDP